MKNIVFLIMVNMHAVFRLKNGHFDKHAEALLWNDILKRVNAILLLHLWMIGTFDELVDLLRFFFNIMIVKVTHYVYRLTKKSSCFFHLLFILSSILPHTDVSILPKHGSSFSLESSTSIDWSTPIAFLDKRHVQVKEKRLLSWKYVFVQLWNKTNGRQDFVATCKRFKWQILSLWGIIDCRPWFALRTLAFRNAGNWRIQSHDRLPSRPRSNGQDENSERGARSLP